MEPQLSHYTQFFIVLSNLAKANLITQDQKAFLKNNLMRKEEKICHLLIQNSGPGKQLEQTLREALLGYLAEQQHKNAQRRRSHKSKTVHFELKQDIPDEDADEQKPESAAQHPLTSAAQVMIEQLSGVLGKHFQKHGSVTEEDVSKLSSLNNLIVKLLGKELQQPQNQQEMIDGLSPLRARFSSENSRLAEISERELDSSDEDVYEKMLRQINETYKELKGIFTGNLHTHLLLMQEDISYENLYQVLKFLLKSLVDADEFTFFIHRDKDWEVYSSQNDSIKDLTVEEASKITEELNYIRPFSIQKVSTSQRQYPQVEESCRAQQYAQTSIVKFQLQIKNYEVLFCLHWTDKDKKNIKRRFINNANTYGFNKDVTHLTQFLVETIITAKVQFFNPLRFADQVQDIGINFMRISRFLLVEGIKKALRIKFQVDKEQTFSTDENVRRGPPENGHVVRIELKDTCPVTLKVKDMNLKSESDQHLLQDIIRYQEKYDAYVKLCYEKSAFYKYFLRTSDSLLFDFNKLGKLVFLSRPISKSMREQYQIQFDPKAIFCNKISFEDIFPNNSMISKIEVNSGNIHENRRNQYVSNQENPQFEIFMKVVDNEFKGFSVIFHENEDRRLKQYLMKLKIDTLQSEHQRDSESNKSLEEDIQKSIQKFYNKHQTFKFLNQLDETQDIANNMISLFIPENELEYIKHVKHRKSNPNLKDQTESPIQSSQTMDQWYQKKKKVASNFYIKYNKALEPVNPDSFEVQPQDSALDEFGFNILAIDSPEEKQRIVYSILQRNGFVQEYKMNLNQLGQFLSVLQRKYNKRGNPFHNYDHGIAVMQSAHFMCLSSKAVQLIDQFKRMATIISGLCHDVSHTARTNIFMINSQSKLATRYHDSSPLEQHHAATTMFMLRDPNLNFLSNLSKEQFLLFRRVLIDNILYTDIKVHFSLLKDFESRIKEESGKPFGTGDDDIKILTGMIIHTADFNGGAKVFELSRVWSERVNKEFSAQYEEEGKLGIAQTPFLKDLDKLHVMAKSEMGFFKVIVRPLWFTLNSFLDGYLAQSIVNLDNTIISWEKIYHANLPKEEQGPQQQK